MRTHARTAGSPWTTNGRSNFAETERSGPGLRHGSDKGPRVRQWRCPRLRADAHHLRLPAGEPMLPVDHAATLQAGPLAVSGIDQVVVSSRDRAGSRRVSRPAGRWRGGGANRCRAGTGSWCRWPTAGAPRDRQRGTRGCGAAPRSAPTRCAPRPGAVLGAGAPDCRALRGDPLWNRRGQRAFPPDAGRVGGSTLVVLGADPWGRREGRRGALQPERRKHRTCDGRVHDGGDHAGDGRRRMGTQARRWRMHRWHGRQRGLVFFAIGDR